MPFVYQYLHCKMGVLFFFFFFVYTLLYKKNVIFAAETKVYAYLCTA